MRSRFPLTILLSMWNKFISIDRLLLVLRPVHPKWYKCENVRILIILIWLCSMITAVFSVLSSGILSPILHVVAFIAIVVDKQQNPNVVYNFELESIAWKVLLDFEKVDRSNSTHGKENISYMDEIIDSKVNLSTSLCIASFPPSVTLLSTTLSFVIPGIIIVCSNTGNIQ